MNKPFKNLDQITLTNTLYEIQQNCLRRYDVKDIYVRLYRAPDDYIQLQTSSDSIFILEPKHKSSVENIHQWHTLAVLGTIAEKLLGSLQTP